MTYSGAVTYVVTCLLAIVTSRLSDVVANQPPGAQTPGNNLSSCRKDLGMYSRAIPDSSITASSSYDERNVGPLNSRIRTERNGGAWCPKQLISKEVYEWLEVDLGQLTIVSLVETQGRFGNGQGQEFATLYRLEYQRREGDDQWHRYYNHSGSEILKGNINTYMAEVRELRPPIIARRIRFVPHSNHPRTVCMRIELFGCVSRDGILSYSMRQGDRRGSDLEFKDFTYDGYNKSGQLTGGLGQLVDGEEGLANFRLYSQEARHRGYEWIAWKTDRLPASVSDPVEILFELDGLRAVKRVRVHANNAFSRDVAVFSAAELRFSLDGEHFVGDPVYFQHYRDTLVELPRYVIIPVPSPAAGRVARFVRLLLYFEQRWIMISEVHIDSEAVNGTNLEESDYDDLDFSTIEPAAAVTASLLAGNSGRNSSSVTTATVHTVPGSRFLHRGPAVIEIDLYNNDANGRYSEVAATKADLSAPSPLPVLPPHEHNQADFFVAVLLGTTGAFIVIVCAVGLVIVIQCHRRGQRRLSHLKALPATGCGNMTGLNYIGPSATTVTSNAKVSNGIVYNAVSTADYAPQSIHCSPTHKRPDPTTVCKLNNVLNTSSHSDVMGQAASGNLKSVQTTHVANYCLLDVDDTWQLQNRRMVAKPVAVAATPRGGVGMTGAIYPAATSTNDASTSDDQRSLTSDDTSLLPDAAAARNKDIADMTSSVVEFPRQLFKFVEKIGDGVFGEAQVCEMNRAREFIGDDCLSEWTPMSQSSTILVAVRTLRKFANNHDRNEFDRATKQLSRFTDSNVAQMLGVIRQGEPLSIVMEYLPYGDLRQFLLRRVFNDGSNVHAGEEPSGLSYGCLIYMATQIASGMKFLSEHGIVHRDLAARNCLVGSKLKVKVADFGLVGGGRYGVDYFQVDDGAGLPVRWMACESIVMRKYTSRSDVWSFGVTLWETLSFSRRRPFDSLTDNQLVEDHVNHFRTGQPLPCLPRPRVCPREIYDLMLECWNADDALRPSFREIHMFLTRKSMGYRPTDIVAAACGSGTATTLVDGSDNLGAAVDMLDGNLGLRQ